MDIAQQLGQQWSQRIANEHPEIGAEDRGAIVNWLLGESPERLNSLTEPDLPIARQAIEYRYRILQQRYLNVSPEKGYQRLIKRLSSLFLIRNKIKVWISLSRDRRRTVVDVIQEVVQEMMHSDRHLAQQIEWISTYTPNSRLRNLLMLASIEEYCLRPIRDQPLITYRFVNYLRRSQRGGMTEVPTGELVRLVSDEISVGDGENLLSLLDVEAWSRYQDEQNELEILESREDVVDETLDGDITLGAVLGANKLSCQVVVDFFPKKVKMGEETKVCFIFRSILNDLDSDLQESEKMQVIQLNSDSDDLNIFLSAKNCLLKGGATASLPSFNNLDQSAIILQSIEFTIIPILPGSSDIIAEIYEGWNFIAKISASLEVDNLDEFNLISRIKNNSLRPVSHPNFLLYIKCFDDREGDVNLEFFLKDIQGKFFSGEVHSIQKISKEWLNVFKEKLKDCVEVFNKNYPWAEKEIRLSSLGNEIFFRVIPAEIRENIFLDYVQRDYLRSILIFSSKDNWIPWDILHDGKRFLSDSLIIGSWPLELDVDCPYEFPVGSISMSCYGFIEKTESWEQMLNPVGSPPSLILNNGSLSTLSELDSLRGLHIVQSSKVVDCHSLEFPIYLTGSEELSGDIASEIRPAKLTLRKNRPLVSLSFLWEKASNLSNIESTWMPAFIRAGASAFVGPLWAVDPAVDAAFISTFYTRLWRGDALGQAFHTARQMARIAVPESCDWLAYVLYGDPMARPYRPVEGKGYAVVEPIGQDIKDPLPPNQSLRFRLTLRRDPPVWHQDRLIEVAEDLAFDNLQVHIVAFGLEVNPTTVDMSRTPNGNYLGWFTLSAPPTMAGETVPVQVHFADSAEPVHSVTFALQIAAGESE
jgi:hypothetical protein